MNALAFLILGFVCIAGAVGIALVGFGVLGNPERADVKRTLKSIGNVTPSREKASRRDDDFHERVVLPLMDRALRAGRRLTPVERRTRLRLKLDIAGNPYGWDVDRVLALKTVALFIGGAVGFIFPVLVGAYIPALVLAPGLALLGFYAPDLAVYQAAHNRTEQIQRDLPDALDLLTVSVESGLGFDAALGQVARNTSGPVADEFARVLQEMQIGSGRAEAMRSLGDRTNAKELEHFVGAMTQADKLGVPVASVLRVQANEMRVKRSQRAEESAQKVPVKILFPLIFCIMPALFVVIMGPAVISMMEVLGK